MTLDAQQPRLQSQRDSERVARPPSCTMIKKLTLTQWMALTSKGGTAHAELSGHSPGGVANQLGITRQAVHKAVLRGDLDMIHVVDDRTGKLCMNMIPLGSIERFKAKRKMRA